MMNAVESLTELERRLSEFQMNDVMTSIGFQKRIDSLEKQVSILLKHFNLIIKK